MTTTIRLMLGDRAAIGDERLDAFTAQTGLRVEIADDGGDLWLVDETTVVERLRAGLLEPLGRRAHETGLDLDDLPQAAIDRFRAGDMVYAVPYTASANVLVYRADLLDRYGIAVPDTWDDLKATASSLQEALWADGTSEVAGFVGRGSAGFAQNYWLAGESLFPSWGWRWSRGTGRPPLVDEPATRDALTFYTELLREAGPADGAALNAADVARVMGAERAVFAVDTVGVAAELRRARPGIGVAPIPRGPSGRPEPGLSTNAFCIPSSGACPEEAWALVQFLMSPEAMLAEIAAGRLAEAARWSVIESPEYAAAFGADLQEVVLTARRFARINRPLVPRAVEIGEIVGAAIEAAVLDDLTAGDALRGAQAMIDSLEASPDVQA